MEDSAIREGFQKLRPGTEYDALYEAALCRERADWIVGINATRLFSCLYGQTLNVGRVMTPTLAMVVMRDAAIRAFKSEPFYSAELKFRDFQAGGERMKEKAEAEKLVAECCQAGSAIITKVEQKEKSEKPPALFDLTSLQREANRQLGFTAQQTLDYTQALYEKKLVTYPRTDSRYLTDDMAPLVPELVSVIQQSFQIQPDVLAPVNAAQVINSKKVTDHHAIIPTGVQPQGLTDMEKRVFDLIARRFIAVFYPDCKFSTTTVLGEVDKVEFKATGKQILEPGWRVIFAKEQQEEPKEGEEERVLPLFTVGESGPHTPDLTEKWTQPPKPYTEATLLRAMETAGKLVDNDELRDALKENGIGRPSTRAAIIETLFKRHYIRKERKNLIATPTGVELIQLIHEELLKSAELTGIWEKKLREIERRSYDAATFLAELKQMVTEIVYSVLRDNTNRRVTIMPDESSDKGTAKAKAKKGSTSRVKASDAENDTALAKPKRTRKANTTTKEQTTAAQTQPVPTTTQAATGDELIGTPCPLCGKGHIIKGKTSYGCSEWKNGCTFRKPF